MSGHSSQRLDVWTDAGRVAEDLFMLFRNVSPSQAYSAVRWLQLDGWNAEARPTIGGNRRAGDGGQAASASGN